MCVQAVRDLKKYIFFSRIWSLWNMWRISFHGVRSLKHCSGADVGVGTLSQDMMSLSCLNYCIPGCVPSGSDSKESASDIGDPDLIPGSRRSPGEGNGHPLQCSCLENSRDKGDWQLQSMGLQRVGQDCVTFIHSHISLFVVTRLQYSPSDAPLLIFTPLYKFLLQKQGWAM